MFSPITFNVHLATVSIDQLIQDCKDIGVGSLLLMVDNLNDLPLIAEVQRRLPTVQIVARCWHPQDFEFHLPGADGGYKLSPARFLDFFGSLGMEGRYLYALNEPHGYTNVPELIKWTTELIQEARRRNQGKTEAQKIRLCVLNFATGHPVSHENRDQMWALEYESLVRLIVQERSWVMLGLHEYSPGEPWRIGRLAQLLTLCTQLKIDYPRIFISEWGIDSAYDGDPQNGWRTRPITNEEHEYFAHLMDFYWRLYRGWVRAGIVVGLAIFSYGDSGGWGNYRVDNARSFILMLVLQGPKEAIPLAQYPALPLPADLRWRVGTIKSVNGGAGRIRRNPTDLVNNVLNPTNLIPRTAVPGRWLPEMTWNGWLPVEYDGILGWSHRSYLEFNEVSADLLPDDDPLWKSGRIRRFNGGAGRIRTAPTEFSGYASSFIPPTYTDAFLAVKPEWGRWGQVRWNELKGWTHLDYIQFEETIVPETPIRTLSVPYVSQLGNIPANDCGPACCLMLIQERLTRAGLRTMNALTLGTVLAFTPGKGDDTTTTHQLGNILVQFGMTPVITDTLTREAIRQNLERGVPSLVLVAYKHILPSDSFDGGHYVVVVGYSENGFWVHDPYHGGANLFIPNNQMERALTDVSPFASRPYQGVYIP